MQRQAVEVAEEAMSKFQVEKDIAQYIKKEVHRFTIHLLLEDAGTVFEHQA